MGKSVKSLIEKMKVATLFLCLVGFATSQAFTIQRDGEPMPSPPPIESDVRGDDEPMPSPPPIESDVRGKDEDQGPPWETDEPDVRGEDEDGRPPWETDEPDVRGEDEDERPPWEETFVPDVRGEDEDEDVGPPPIRDPEDRYPGCHHADRYGNNRNTNRYSA